MNLDFTEMSNQFTSRPAAKSTRNRSLRTSRPHEAGFTLIEAMIATLVLMFGLTAIFNLMIVATSSNSLANRATVATALAGSRMEVLRATAFTALADSPTDALDVAASPFTESITVPGAGIFVTTWKVQTLTSPNLKLLQVRTEPSGFRGRWGRAEFTSIRSCTTGTASGCL
jgi:Tfp pilus assembly protein PilV